VPSAAATLDLAALWNGQAAEINDNQGRAILNKLGWSTRW
jgi:hypothetical protein